jgi:hypothetical protein
MSIHSQGEPCFDLSLSACFQQPSRPALLPLPVVSWVQMNRTYKMLERSRKVPVHQEGDDNNIDEKGVLGMAFHSSNFQLNLSRFGHLSHGKRPPFSSTRDIFANEYCQYFLKKCSRQPRSGRV